MNKNRSKAIYKKDSNVLPITLKMIVINSKPLKSLVTLKTLKVLKILIALNADSALTSYPLF